MIEKESNILRAGLASYGTASRLSDNYEHQRQRESAFKTQKLKTTLHKIKLKNTLRKMKKRRQTAMKIKKLNLGGNNNF